MSERRSIKLAMRTEASFGKEPPPMPPTEVSAQDGDKVKRVMGILRTLDVVELRQLKAQVVERFLN